MPVNHARAKSLFLAASDLTDPAERAAYLERECGGDAELRGRVEALLRANDAAPLPSPGAEAGTSAHVPDRPGPTEDHGDPTARVGAILAGKYKLIEEIGEGGMGSVYLAQQTEPVKRKVAVKLIKAGMDSKAVMARFEAERQALALMDHPNIAKVLDGGLHDHRPFFVMELVKGVPITDYCDAQKLTPRARLELFVQACQAIQHAHQKGIIHRDIKPSNVLVAMFDDKPVVKIIDFGVAKATGGTLTERTIDTGFGGVVGTPQYMSPEQATSNNLDIDTRSDVYALGVLLYELLAGSPPFSKRDLEKKGLLEILRVVREEEPPRPSTKLSTADALPSLSANRGTEPKKLTGLLRNELDWIVMKALEKDRTRRYETANGFAADVNRYLSGEAVQAHPPSTAYRVKKFVRRNRGQVIAASLVFLALLAGVIGTTIGLVQAQRSAERERLAKLDAEDKQIKAEQAATAEKAAKEAETQAKLEADKKRQEAERNLAFAKKGNEILGSVFAGLDPKKIAESGRPLQDLLRENLGKAVKELEGTAIGEPLEVAAMQDTLGISLLGLGEATMAVDLFTKSLATRTARLGLDHPGTLASLHNLAAAQVEAGKPDLALPLLVEALKHHQTRFGAKHPDTVRIRQTLAMAYQRSGQMNMALPLFEETFRWQQAQFGPDHPNTMLSMNNLAMAYVRADKPDLALPLMEEAVQRSRARLGPQHLSTIINMQNLALVYKALGKRELAFSLLEETLKLRRAQLGPDHPLTLTGLHNLAVFYSEDRKPELAIPLYQEALQYAKARLGPDHPSTLGTMNALAVTYRDAGKLDLALPILEETVQRRMTQLGPDHPDTLNSKGALASLYETLGQLDRSLLLEKTTLEQARAKLGTDHRLTRSAMNNLAATYWKLKQFDKAIPLFEELLRYQEKEHGRNHPDTLRTLGNLAVNYKDTGRLEKAIPLLREVHAQAKRHPGLVFAGPALVDAYVKAKQPAAAAKVVEELSAAARQRWPEDSPQLAVELAQNSLPLLLLGNFVEVEPLLRECLAIRATKEPDAWTTFNTYSQLGGALLGQKKYADAEPLLLKGYEGMKAREKAIPPQGNTRIPEALDRLIELYTATNKPEELKKWQAERAKYPKADPPREEAK